MKKLKSLFVLALVVLIGSVALAACGETTETFAGSTWRLEEIYVKSGTQTVKLVYKDNKWQAPEGVELHSSVKDKVDDVNYAFAKGGATSTFTFESAEAKTFTTTITATNFKLKGAGLTYEVKSGQIIIKNGATTVGSLTVSTNGSELSCSNNNFRYVFVKGAATSGGGTGGGTGGGGINEMENQ